MLKVVKLKKTPVPALPWQEACHKILGGKYELDLIFTPAPFMRQMNRRYRQKNKSTNVLAFSLASRAGEILVDPALAKKEAKFYGEAFKKYLWRLYVHALLHLKGLRHGRTMDKAAAKFLKIKWRAT
ncbi:MAG: rRNA maturation RNase YbeY [bacterium]|nr:rRNA maturation RNase YbeY [bacterium]